MATNALFPSSNFKSKILNRFGPKAQINNLFNRMVIFFGKF